MKELKHINDDYFETVVYNACTPQKKMCAMWDEVDFEGCERTEIELDPDDLDKFNNDWDFPGTEDEGSQLEAQVPPHAVKEPPMSVSHDSKSQNDEDRAHSPPLNDSNPPKNDVPKELLLNRGR